MALDLLSPIHACLKRPRISRCIYFVSTRNEAVATGRILRSVRNQPPVAIATCPPFSQTNHALLQPITSPRSEDPGPCQIGRVRPPAAGFNAAKRNRLSVISDPPHTILWKGWIVMWQAVPLKRLQHLMNFRSRRINVFKSHHDDPILS